MLKPVGLSWLQIKTYIYLCLLYSFKESVHRNYYIKEKVALQAGPMCRTLLDSLNFKATETLGENQLR